MSLWALAGECSLTRSPLSAPASLGRCPGAGYALAGTLNGLLSPSVKLGCKAGLERHTALLLHKENCCSSGK